MSHRSNNADGSQPPSHQFSQHTPQSRSRDMTRAGQHYGLPEAQDGYGSQAMTAAQLAMSPSSLGAISGPRTDGVQMDPQARSRQASRSTYSNQLPPSMSVRHQKPEHQQAYGMGSPSQPGFGSPAAPSYPSRTAGVEIKMFSPMQGPTGSPSHPNPQYVRQDLSSAVSHLNSPRTPSSLDQTHTMLNPASYSHDYSRSSGALDQPTMPVASLSGPIPQFKRLKSTHDLDPLLNAQPQFRRAHPEGGFISVGSRPLHPIRLRG